MSTPSASITIRPQFPQEEPIFGVRTPGDTNEFAELPSWKEAINPLHYIPFVSQVYEEYSGNPGNAALKLIGGAILGGPLGFIAGLANVIFEQETGHGVVGAVASALMGEEPTQVAAAEPATTTASLREADAAPTQEILPPLKQAQADTSRQAQMQLASAMADIGKAKSEDAVLTLFGGATPSAHQSYQKAQMLPYLQDVSTSLVM